MRTIQADLPRKWIRGVLTDTFVEGRDTGALLESNDNHERQRKSNSHPVDDNGRSTVEIEGDQPVIRVSGLSKTFGSGEDAVTAIEDVSFEIQRGQVVGLLGPNGAGKTTTVKAMLGLVVPDAGRVEICGVDRSRRPRVAYKRVGAMMEGARNQYWRLTVRENLAYFAAISGENPAAIRDRHDELLDAFDLQEFADEEVRHLSRGMKQKVSIASTLARDVDVVFLDEPTLGLDVESAYELREQLRKLASKQDLTVLVTSHDMDAIEDVCDRVIIMDGGRVIANDRIESLLAGFEKSGYVITARGIEVSSIPDLAGTDTLQTVSESDGRVRIEATADGEAFHRLVGELLDHGARLDTVETKTPDLETAFVDLTENSSEEGEA